MKKKTNAEIGMETTRNAIVVHNRLANAILEEKKRMEREGMEVPLFSIYVKGDTRHPWKPEKYFNKNFKSYIEQIKKTYGLSVTEMGIISILSYHITYENNLITNEDGTPMIKKDLEKVLGIRQNAVDKYMAALVKKGAFASVKVKRSVNYYLDPRIAYQGNKIDSTLLSMFHIKTS
jgi:hypothetical protein